MSRGTQNPGPMPGPAPSGYPNLTGRCNVPDRLTLRSLLGKHLDGIVRHEIPDAEGNQHVTEISRLELLVQLMVQTVFKPKDTDHPSFRAECLKQILARIDPVDKDGVTVGRLNIIVNSPAAMIYATRLQALEMRDGESRYEHVMEVLDAMPIRAMMEAEVDHDSGGPTPQLDAADTTAA